MYPLMYVHVLYNLTGNSSGQLAPVLIGSKGSFENNDIIFPGK